MNCPSCDSERSDFTTADVYLELEGRDLASLAHAYVELGQPERAREVAQRVSISCRNAAPESKSSRTSWRSPAPRVAAGHDDAVDALLARAESLIGTMRAVKFDPHLAEIRADRARRRGDQATWRAELTAAQRLFAETGATGHAERVSCRLAAADAKP